MGLRPEQERRSALPYSFTVTFISPAVCGAPSPGGLTRAADGDGASPLLRGRNQLPDAQSQREPSPGER